MKIKILNVMIAFLAAFAIILAVMLPLDAAASQCWEPKSSEQMFAENWNEQPVAYATTVGGELIRRYENAETGTWSLTIITKSGKECPITAGEGWKHIQKPGDPA